MSKRPQIDKIIIVDFGSQVTKLIARRVRENKVFSEILTIEDLKKKIIYKCKRYYFIGRTINSYKKIISANL